MPHTSIDSDVDFWLAHFICKCEANLLRESYVTVRVMENKISLSIKEGELKGNLKKKD